MTKLTVDSNKLDSLDDMSFSNPSELFNFLNLDGDSLNYGKTVDDTYVCIFDWNELDHQDYIKITSKLREMSYDDAFDDQYSLCGDCCKFVSTQPGYYGDLELPIVLESCGELICPDCVRNNPNDYIEEIKNDPRRANHILSDSQLEELGWKKIREDLESGWYPGQNDDPVKIYNTLRNAQNYTSDLLFSIDRAGQFDLEFSLWLKDED